MTIHNFAPITLHATKTGKCLCSRRVTRSITFEQTVNPFNKKADGKVKGYSDIMPELKAEREKWLGLPTTHARKSRYELTPEQRAECDQNGTAVLTCGEVINLTST